MSSDQRDFFRSSELAYWAGAEGLKADEAALIGRWLDPAKSLLDGGTGGGRIPRALAALSFRRLTGFDFAPEMIAAARTAPGGEQISFDIADATSLPYPDGSFEQITYLQQVICTIDDPAGRTTAMAEAARVLAKGGTALFSFVCLESRLASVGQRAYVSYLRALRRLKRDARHAQSMPRLRRSGRADLSALRDRGPFNWWYRAEEAEADLKAAGFEVIGVGFERAALEGTLSPSASSALAGGAAGTLYVVGRGA